MSFNHQARALALEITEVGKTIRGSKKRIKFSFIFDG